MIKKLIPKRIEIVKQSFPIKWEDIKDFEFDDKDQIATSYDEEDDYHSISVFRHVLETDDELAKRERREADHVKFLKGQRYGTYLQLKKEFEP